MTSLKEHFGPMRFKPFLPAILILLFAFSASAQSKRKVIIDQDARGPATTDQQSILVFLQSPEVETLGITVVSGDMWRDEEVAHTLRMLEIVGRTDIPSSPVPSSRLSTAKKPSLVGRRSTARSHTKAPGIESLSGMASAAFITAPTKSPSL